MHPSERIPHYLQEEDFKMFEEDYELRDNERIKEHLIAFDDLIFTLLIGGKNG